MLQNLRQHLALVLLALLPFHALLVTVGTKLIAGAGSAPLSYLAIWKEVVLALILFVAITEIGKQLAVGSWQLARKFDVLDILIIALLLIALFTSYSQLSTLNSQLFYGFKYDFLPLIAFLILRRVPWSPQFVTRAINTIITVGVLVSVYALIALVLPATFFHVLGYSDLHSLYNPSGPLAAFQQIEGTMLRRAQGPMSGPNQLGLWMLLPLGLVLWKWQMNNGKWQKLLIVHCSLFILVILLTMSRAAVLAAGIMMLVSLWQTLDRKTFFKAVTSLGIAGLIGVGVLMVAMPSILLRATSSAGHIERPLAAIATMIEHPLGLGLGSAGPASNRVSDTCVHLPKGSDASWAADRPSLCVFVGDTQVQPASPCNCPLLPENWYLQIGVELGVLGFVMYIFLIGLIIFRLSDYPTIRLPGLAFIGVSIAALFLHAWEDSAVAYSIWLLAAVSIRTLHPWSIQSPSQSSTLEDSTHT